MTTAIMRYALCTSAANGQMVWALKKSGISPYWFWCYHLFPRPDETTSGSGTGLLEAPAAMLRCELANQRRCIDVRFSQQNCFARHVLSFLAKWCHHIVIDVRLILLKVPVVPREM